MMQYQCFKNAIELLTKGNEVYGDSFAICYEKMDEFEDWCDDIDRFMDETEGLMYEITVNEFGDMEAVIHSHDMEIDHHSGVFERLLDTSRIVTFYGTDRKDEITLIRFVFHGIWKK